MAEIQYTIYPALNRQATHVPGRKSRHTFDNRLSKDWHAPHFEALIALDDETLAPGNTASLTSSLSTTTIILPVEGAIEITRQAKTLTVEVGSLAIINSACEEVIALRNCYEAAWVNFIILQFGNAQNAVDEMRFCDFDIVTNINHLITLDHIVPSIAIHLGHYQGRMNGSLTLTSDSNVFAFVIDGVCEINDRLLEARDGLAIRCCRDVQFESLTADAIVFFVSGL